MDEVDKRIAEEVMGEPEPEVPTDLLVRTRDNDSPKGCWIWTSGSLKWQPLPFSSDLDQAMRAVDKYIEDYQEEIESLENTAFHFAYSMYDMGERGRWFAGFSIRMCSRYGQTLPEAICNLLLALVDSERLEILNEITKESQELGLYDDD